MATKRGFVKRASGKRSPDRSASWVLKRIDTWQRFHSSIPIRYKVPIILISGYVLTLIIALVFIGGILNLIIDQFENELQNKGFGGFAKLYTLNKSIHESSLAKLLSINLAQLPVIQEKAIEELPGKLEELKKFIRNSDALYQNVITRLNSLTREVDEKSSATTLADYREKLYSLDAQIIAANRSFRAIDDLFKDKSKMEELIFSLVVPVNSYQLQCGDRSPQSEWSKFNSKWELIKSEQPKYLYLGPYNNSTSSGPDIYDFLTQLTIKLAPSLSPHFLLSESSLTEFPEGYAVKLKVKEKLSYAPASITCGLWLRKE